jgi:hypothetical protein
LKARLQLQELIGQIGEEVAFQEELARLAKTKVTDPESFVELLSTKDVSAGCDIKSYDPNTQTPIYIEVKSSTIEGNKEFYISRNEVEFLKEHGKRPTSTLFMSPTLRPAQARWWNVYRTPFRP